MSADPWWAGAPNPQPDFPDQYARTSWFTAGVPRDVTVSPDGRRVVFCRSRGGRDTLLCLWVLDVESGTEHLVADPVALDGTDPIDGAVIEGAALERAGLEGAGDAPTAEELARRERDRDPGSGITAYATDADVRRAVFAHAGRLWLADLVAPIPEPPAPPAPAAADDLSEDSRPGDRQTSDNSAEQGSAASEDAAVGEDDPDTDDPDTDDPGPPRYVVELPATGPVVDPRLDPTGARVAYVADGGVRVIDVDGGADRALAMPEATDVTYGEAEFVAAEELGRHRGHWWSPNGDRVAIARVDLRNVQRWYVADPADPAAPPTVLRYPMVGTPNAEVSLWLVDLAGRRQPVEFGWHEAEYLATVTWDRGGLHVVVLNRSQTILRLYRVDLDTGYCDLVREERDQAWVPVVPGVPAHTEGGELVWAAETPWPPRAPNTPDAEVDADEPVESSTTAHAKHVERFEPHDTRRLLVGGTAVTPAGMQVREVRGVDGDTVLFTASDESIEGHLWTWSARDGLRRLSANPGLHTGWIGGGTVVVASRLLREHGVRTTVLPAPDLASDVGGGSIEIASYAETPCLTPAVELIRAGEHQLRVAVLFPREHVHGSRRLPVLLDPYGGPAGQRVLAARGAYLLPQWLADQGFCVVIADGRGTPGRSPSWDRTIQAGAETDLNLEDQIVALHTAAERFGDLDLDRVAIRGWSHGGWLAALAVLRRPDVFHAASAGAPVTERRLYDTAYSERYIGLISGRAAAYDHGSLIADAPNLARPLLLIHGLADDNVLALHSLRLSAALTAAGRPHHVLPLSATTHGPRDPAMVSGLLRIELDFLRRSLGMDADEPDAGHPGTAHPEADPGAAHPGTADPGAGNLEAGLGGVPIG